MRLLKYSLLLFSLGLSSCASRQPAPDPSAYLSNYKAVPEDVIAKLPRKIARLPVTKSMRGGDFLGALDLEDYSGNISGSVRFNSHFMQLDRDHILQIRCDPESLTITRANIDHILNSLPANPTKTDFPAPRFTVIGCTLRKNWDEVIANRWLEEKKMQNKSVVATADNVSSSLRSGRSISAVPHF
jgi:hypothetical protein